MKKLLILLLLCCHFGYAQPGKKYVSMTDPLSVIFGPCDLSKYEILDSAKLCVTYRMETGHNDTGGRQFRDKMILEIGNRYVKYYSLLKYLNDKLYTLSISGRPLPENLRALQRDSGNGGENIGVVILTDNAGKQLTVTQFVPFVSGQTLVYREPVPEIAWNISDSTDTLSKYPCFRADATFRGRHYTAWYTPEIPINAGPWKFSGLPGLILKVEDSGGLFRWECIGIEQKNVPIERFKYPAKTTTREKFLSFERQYHEAPKTMLGQGGTVVFRQWDKATQTGRDLDDSWTIPYTPIELE